jgi:hypothetical protein
MSDKEQNECSQVSSQTSTGYKLDPQYCSPDSRKAQLEEDRLKQENDMFFNDWEKLRFDR